MLSFKIFLQFRAGLGQMSPGLQATGYTTAKYNFKNKEILLAP